MSVSGWFRLTLVMGKLKCIAAQSRESVWGGRSSSGNTLKHITTQCFSFCLQCSITIAHNSWLDSFHTRDFSCEWGIRRRAMLVANESLQAALCPIPAKVELGKWQKNPTRAPCFLPLLGEGQADGCLDFHDLGRPIISKHHRKGAFM